MAILAFRSWYKFVIQTGVPIMALKSTNPDILFYEQAAREYCESLPLEHFMQSTFQTTQCKITLESFDLICAVRPEIHIFSELLVQYGPISNLLRVVPDNMVIIYEGEIEATGSYNMHNDEKSKPFLMIEYVSESNKRKDYVDNMVRYERDLHVPYYLLFEPENQVLSLFEMNARKKYVAVKANAQERFAIPELDLEVGILDSWVRYWFRGELQALPVELSEELDKTKAALKTAVRRLGQSERRAGRVEIQLDQERKERGQAEANAIEERRLRVQAERRNTSVESELAKLQAEIERLRNPAKNG